MNEDLSPHAEEPLNDNGITLCEGMFFDYEAKQYIIRHLDESTNTARCEITWSENFDQEKAFRLFNIDSVLDFCQAKLVD